MNTGQTVAVTAGACLVAVLVVLCIALGWIQGSATLKIVPPWNRRASTRKEPSSVVAAVEREASAATAVQNQRRDASGRFARTAPAMLPTEPMRRSA